MVAIGGRQGVKIIRTVEQRSMKGVSFYHYASHDAFFSVFLPAYNVAINLILKHVLYNCLTRLCRRHQNHVIYVLYLK
jgi:hypothetical protein